MKLKYQNYQKRLSDVMIVLLWLALICLGFCSCGPLIARYDPTAVQNAISLKERALAVVEKAGEPYDLYKAEVKSLVLEMDEARRLADATAKNELAVEEWDIIMSPNRNLLGRFLALWQERKKLHAAFIAEAKQAISLAFDELIRLENGKPRH